MGSSDLTYQKGWQSDEQSEWIEETITLHAGSRNGFIHNSKLIFKDGLSSGDSHREMNSVNFEKKWFNESFYKPC